MEKLITTKEAAKIIGVTVTTVRSHISRGRLAAEKFGRQWAVKESDAISYRDRDQKTGRPKKSTSDTPE